MPTPTHHMPTAFHLVDQEAGSGAAAMVRGYQQVSRFVKHRLTPTLELIVTMADQVADIFAAGPAPIVEATWWRADFGGGDGGYATVTTHDPDAATTRRFTIFVPPIDGVAATLGAADTFAPVDDRSDLDGDICECDCDCAAEDDCDCDPACTCPAEAAPVT